MVSKNLESVMEVMHLLIGVERAVSDFYQACSKRFPQNQDFWKQLEHEETVHAEMLSLMLRRVSENPQEFQVGNVASITGINSFVERLQEDLQKVQSGQLDEDAAIFKAFHIESTFIEQKYTEAVRTQNEKYLSVLNQLRAETDVHKAKIAKRMKSHKSYESPA